MQEEDKNKINEEVEKQIKEIVNEGIQAENVNMLYKLVDIHKDLANEDYWCEKKEVMKMRYRTGDYGDEYSDGSYGRRGVPGTGRGRYRGDSYGRRGVPGTGRGRYRGNDPMEEMQEHYNDYNESSNEMYNGNYGAENEMIKSVEGIMKNIYEIVEELAETENQEVMHIIQKYAKKIEDM